MRSCAAFHKIYNYPKMKDENIRIDYDFKYNDKGELDVYEVGKTDINAEVHSHKDEVGLFNVIKNAIAHGIDPRSMPFASSSSESLPDIPEPQTWDDVDKIKTEALAQLKEISKKLGITEKDLVDNIGNKAYFDELSKKNEVNDNGEK